MGRSRGAPSIVRHFWRSTTIPCRRQLQAGTGWINNWAVVYDETEEGGYKQSGLGRLNGVSAIDDFVEYRTVIHEIGLDAKRY
ncbi:aldehyde dehydrogenase family protein [Paraburkholderia youngii]|uniref:aldehyde dehydrogenase family protein n=1 Tax=Paraburkholderia youngii TaxID=2782701 RepID=UPI003D1F012C